MKSIIRYSLLFWLVFYAVITLFISPLGELNVVLLRVASFMIPQMILFYLNMIILLPRYHEQDKKGAYWISLFLITATLVTSFGFLDMYLDHIHPLEVRHFEERTASFVFLGRFMSFVPPVIIGALIRKSIQLQQKTQESLELQNKMLAAETNALKAQINPHFLFNTLNNIYSLSQFNNKKTGEAILQLSDILRYVTYEGDQKYVALSSEVDHIRSFIKLQLLRDEDDSNISIEIDVDDNSLKISPLLLIPFIENSFKHSNHHDKKNGWIKISIQNKDSQLIMKVANSTSNEVSTPKDNVGGVGMENVKRRLSLLYPNHHDLVLRIDKTSYLATLHINLKK